MMIRRVSVAAAVAALSLGCSNAKREKAVADSIAAAAAADSARMVAAADSVRRDSAKGAAALAAKSRPAGSKSTANSKTPVVDTKAKATGTSSQGIGRDSVRQGPIIGVPLKPDTTKKRPPF